MLVVDETEILASGKNSFRIITVNETIAERLIQKYRATFTKYVCLPQTDKRHKELYFEYSFYFKNNDYDAVLAYIKKEFK